MQAIKLHVTVDDAMVRVLPALSALLGHRVELIALQEETPAARPGQGGPPPRTPQAGALAGKIALKPSFDDPLPDDGLPLLEAQR